MKKRGFTLTEVLIAICVIGVLSAIMAPTISNITPEKGRVAVIQFYSKLAELNNALLADEALYTTIKNNDNDPCCIGFGCTAKTLRVGSKYDSDEFSGITKYMNLVSDNLGIDNPKQVVSAGPIEFNYSPSVKCEIKSESGTTTINETEAETLSSTITLTVNDNRLFNNMEDCYYSASCQNPNRYILKVDTYGNISGGDELTEVILRNPTRMNNRKQDYIDAKKLLDE